MSRSRLRKVGSDIRKETADALSILFVGSFDRIFTFWFPSLIGFGGGVYFGGPTGGFGNKVHGWFLDD